MKNIIKSLLLGVIAATPAFLTSCESDRDSNPTFSVPSSFVLNVPANAANNTYDLATSDFLVLTATQPDYNGIPMATTYSVQVSIDPAFQNVQPSEAAPAVAYTELTSTYTSAYLKVEASELNDALVQQYLVTYGDYPSDPIPAYIRLRAAVHGGTSSTVEYGNVFSNVITLPSVKASYKAPELTLPTELYVCGASIGTAWSTWKPMAPVYDMDGEFYTLYYTDGADGGFKWGEYEQQWLGYDAFKTINDNAGAGVSTNGDGNIVLGTAGWYVLYVTSKISGAKIDYTLNIEKGGAGVIGAAFDDSWTGIAMDVPAGKTEWVSPAATGSGELRAYITVPGRDWWRTEFTLYKGALYWRTVNIPQNWAENVGADYSVSVSAGEKLYVDFDNNTGYVK